jgi:hypothetical protein
MKEYFVTKRIISNDSVETEELSNTELENSEDMDAFDELETFYVVKIKDGKKDITSQIDTSAVFEGDEELAEYLGKVFNENPEDIEIIEEESSIEIQ